MKVERRDNVELSAQDYELFQRPFYTFKQIKEAYSTAEVEKIKDDYKIHWQKWKELHLQVAKNLPKEWQMEKPKIESWTNGWNLRSHFWSAYRSEPRKKENACLATLLNEKQLQVYLMYQHYKSEERKGKVATYNRLLNELEEWSKGIALDNYYIWPQSEHELADHLSLSTYLEDEGKRKEFQEKIAGKSFQIGKFYFYPTILPEVEGIIEQTLYELMPLYQKLAMYED